MMWLTWGQLVLAWVSPYSKGDHEPGHGLEAKVWICKWNLALNKCIFQLDMYSSILTERRESWSASVSDPCSRMRAAPEIRRADWANFSVRRAIPDACKKYRTSGIVRLGLSLIGVVPQLPRIHMLVPVQNKRIYFTNKDWDSLLAFKNKIKIKMD